MALTFAVRLLALSALVSAAPDSFSQANHPASPKCPMDDKALFMASTGTHFEIECFVDRSGIDLSHYYKDPDALFQPNFESCIESCDAIRSCVEVSFIPEMGVCHLKAMRGPPSDNGVPVWGARLWDGVHPREVESAFNNPATPSRSTSTLPASPLIKRLVSDGEEHQMPLASLLPLLKSVWSANEREEAKERFFAQFEEAIEKRILHAQRESEPYAHYQEKLLEVGRALWPVNEEDRKIFEESYIDGLIGIRTIEDESEWEEDETKEEDKQKENVLHKVVHDQLRKK